MPTRDLIGESVIDSRGQVLGEIQDLVVNPKTGRILCAIVTFGGFLGVGAKLFAAPWRRLRWKTLGDDTVIALDVCTLEHVPRFDSDDWDRLGDPAWLAGLEEAFERCNGSGRGHAK